MERNISLPDSAQNADIEGGTAPKIRAESVERRFDQSGQPMVALDNVDFFALNGEFVSIVGPSGCGKSTLLNIIAGLDEPDSGAIYLDGVRQQKRLGTVGYMQQKDLLLPWRTVLDNLIIGPEIHGISKADARNRALEMIDDFGLKGFENEYPYALSGGMRQRAAFLRTVLADQEMFLLDEPFGALDALNRANLQEWLQELWQRLGKTIVLVTHDVDEAIFLSDRIYVMSARPGRIRRIENVDFPRPRTQEMLTSPDFVAMKASLLAQIRREEYLTAEGH